MIKNSFSLGLHYPTREPFLFCAHHFDRYPQGQSNLGPDPKLLAGRSIGMDFDAKDGFRMYHGEHVPGFPVHPHRGFETITLVRQGFVDHSDSLGAAGRYGPGDVQWLTAGAGIQHSEMFPLLYSDRENPCELFQIWLNLPKRSKLAQPHFTMHWAEEIPRAQLDQGRVAVTVIAGSFADAKALAPPPESWAADPANDVLILLVQMKHGGTFQLQAASGAIHRTLYFFAGRGLELNGQKAVEETGFELESREDLKAHALGDDIEFLLLQARPIGEPIVQRGPFVMNTQDEIIQTIRDYQRTEFGGWPWPQHDMVHGSTPERFARYPDGRIERRPIR